MMWSQYLQSLAGGLLIGTAAAIFLLGNGRIAGISGILGNVLGAPNRQTATNLAFLAGLLGGAWLFLGIAGHAPPMRIGQAWWPLVAGGLLVGFGTRLGSGCTSGHGVCGLARLSPRSMAAVGMFLATAIITVFVTHHVLGGGAS